MKKLIIFILCMIMSINCLGNLHKAAAQGNLKKVKRLIEEEGVSIDAQNPQKLTPLHLAAFFGHMDIVRYLLEKEGQKANIEAKNLFDETPLHMAARKNKLNIMRYLLEERKGGPRANIDARNSDNNTPLSQAAFGENLETVKYLIEKGANINAKDNHLYETPLGSAVHRIEYLKPKDKPLKIAQTMKKIIKYLIHHGASVSKEVTELAKKLDKKQGKLFKDLKIFKEYQDSLYQFVKKESERYQKALELKKQAQKDVRERLEELEKLKKHGLVEQPTKIKVGGKEIEVYVPFEK